MDNKKMLKIVSEDGVYWSFLTKDCLEKQLLPAPNKPMKKGDEVWVREFYPYDRTERQIVAHFPKEEKVELPSKLNWTPNSYSAFTYTFNKLIDYIVSKEKGDGQ